MEENYGRWEKTCSLPSNSDVIGTHHTGTILHDYYKKMRFVMIVKEIAVINV